MRFSLTAYLLTVAAGSVLAQPRAIDTTKSSMTVLVGKAGAFSMMGHDHEITAPIAKGTVDAAAHTVQLEVDAAAMRVADPNVSDKDRNQIQKTMEGPEVLDSTRYPTIVFRSTAAEPGAAGAWNVRGNLTLHGSTQPVTCVVRESGGHYTGDVRFKQTGFGIKPVSAGGGTVRVKDELEIKFDIQLAQ